MPQRKYPRRSNSRRKYPRALYTISDSKREGRGATLAAQDPRRIGEGGEGIQQREIHGDLGRERSSVWEEGSTPRGSWRRRDSGRDTKIGGWLGFPRLPRDPARQEGLSLRSDDPAHPSAGGLASASGFLHHRRRSGRDAGTARQTRLAARFDSAGGCI